MLSFGEDSGEVRIKTRRFLSINVYKCQEYNQRELQRYVTGHYLIYGMDFSIGTEVKLTVLARWPTGLAFRLGITMSRAGMQTRLRLAQHLGLSAAQGRKHAAAGFRCESSGAVGLLPEFAK